MSDCFQTTKYFGETVNGRWEVEGFIGGGAFGSVYAARDKTTEHFPTAIKFAGGEALEKEDTIGCLRAEWRVLRYLNCASPHLRVPIVYEQGSHNGTEYIVMEKLGVSLQDWLNDRDRPVSNMRILKTLNEVFNIVRRLHENNVLHGDLSEKNIVFGRGRSDVDNLYIIDFGNSSEYNLHSSLFDDLGEICHIMIRMFRNGGDEPIPDCEKRGFFWESMATGRMKELVEKAFEIRRRLRTPIPNIVRELVHELFNGDEANYNRIENLFNQAIHAQREKLW
ncbi:unnamed protein product [Agarophyton chilense]